MCLERGIVHGLGDTMQSFVLFGFFAEIEFILVALFVMRSLLISAHHNNYGSVVVVPSPSEWRGQKRVNGQDFFRLRRNAL